MPVAARFLVASLLLALTGCWTGGPFFRASDAVPALPTGTYVASRTALPGERAQEGPGRIDIRADGMTTFTDTEAAPNGDPVLVMGFTPLEGAEGRFLAWVVHWDNRDLSGDRSAYGILSPDADGTYRLQLPGCTGPMAAQARAAGASASRNADGLAICTFPDRASLVTALRAFVAAPPPEVLTLTFRPRG
jgi:hypothetical protein